MLSEVWAPEAQLVYQHTVHLIKKLTSTPVHTGTGTGTGELCTTVWACYRYGYGYRRSVGHIVRPKSKQDGGICLARRFRTIVASRNGRGSL